MRVVLLALAAALAVVLSGCGASDPIAAEEVSAAAEKTAAAGSSRIEITGKGDEAFGMHGLADYEGRRATLTYKLATAPGAEKLDTFEVRVIGRRFYIDASLFGIGEDPSTGEQPKPWLAMDFDEEDVTLDTLIVPVPFVDPVELLSTFQEVSGTVSGLGEESVRGVPTQGYRLVLDLERLIERAPARARPGLREQLAERKETTQPVDVWIDEDGRARRVRLSIESESATIDFFDFGVEVDVEAPPEDQVEELDAHAFSKGDVEVDSGVTTVEEDE